MDRRLFLKSASLLSVGALASMSCKGGADTDAITQHKRFGLQVFGVCLELAKDIPAGLRRLKEIGYDTLELAGYNDGNIALFHDPISLIDYKKMAEDAGLEITSSHVRTPQSVYTRDNKQEVLDFWKQTVEHHALLGITYLVQAAVPTCRNVEDVELVAEVFNEAGRIAQDAGMLFTFRQFYANGMKDFFVEDENFRSGHQFERVAESAKYLQEAAFV